MPRLAHAHAALARITMLGLAALCACSTDPPPPRGYHSPNVAWSEHELGVVWLHREMASEQVLFTRARENAEPIGRMELSHEAWSSDPPLVASDGRGWMVAWTQGGGRSPALYVRAVGPEGPQGPARAIVEASVHLCPQLLWTGDGYVVGWHEDDELYLGRIGTHGLMADAPQRVAEAPSIGGCRLAWNGSELGVLWWSPPDDGPELELVRVSPRGAIRERVAVRTAAPAAEPIDLAWHDDGWVVATTTPASGGASTVRVRPGGGQEPGPAIAREGFVRGLSLAASSWLGALWVEAAKPGASRGHVYFDLLGQGADPLALDTDGRARTRVSTSAREHQVAVTWNTMRGSETSVHWGIIRLRPGGEGWAITSGAIEP